MWEGLNKNLKMKKRLCEVSFQRDELLMGDWRLRMEQSLLRGSRGMWRVGKMKASTQLQT
jgi:hypothetical protein